MREMLEEESPTPYYQVDKMNAKVLIVLTEQFIVNFRGC